MDKLKELFEKVKQEFIEKKWLKWVAVGVAAVLVLVIILASVGKGNESSAEGSSGLNSSTQASNSVEGNSSLNSSSEEISIGGGASNSIGGGNNNSFSSGENGSGENGESAEDGTSSDDHDHSHDHSSSGNQDSSSVVTPEIPEDEKTGDPSLLWFELSADGEYYIVKGIGRYTAPKLEIPALIYNDEQEKFLLVKEIAENAFYDCSTLKSVVISDSVMRIGRLAFASCVNLNTVKFGVMVQYIGWGAFDNCDNITKVVFAETSGWSVTTATDWQNSKGIALSAADLADSAKAAYLLVGKGQYNHYHWKRMVY